MPAASCFLASAKEARAARSTALLLFGARSALTEHQLYQLDQYVLGGGSLVVFLNPWDVRVLNVTPKGEMTDTGMTKNSSNIGELLATWGIAPDGGLVAEKTDHDVLNVLSVVRQGQLAWQTQRQFPYPLLPVFHDMATESPLVRAIASLMPAPSCRGATGHVLELDRFPAAAGLGDVGVLEAEAAF